MKRLLRQKRAMIQINFYIDSRYPVDRAALRAKAQAILEKHGIHHVQLDVSIVGKRKIQTLNEQKLHPTSSGAADRARPRARAARRRRPCPSPAGRTGTRTRAPVWQTS